MVYYLQSVIMYSWVQFILTEPEEAESNKRITREEYDLLAVAINMKHHYHSLQHQMVKLLSCSYLPFFSSVNSFRLWHDGIQSNNLLIISLTIVGLY